MRIFLVLVSIILVVILACVHDIKPAGKSCYLNFKSKIVVVNTDLKSWCKYSPLNINKEKCRNYLIEVICPN